MDHFQRIELDLLDVEETRAPIEAPPTEPVIVEPMAIFEPAVVDPATTNPTPIDLASST